MHDQTSIDHRHRRLFPARARDIRVKVISKSRYYAFPIFRTMDTREHVHLLACLIATQPLHLPVHILRTRSQIRILQFLPTPSYESYQGRQT
jgi:REP element-mobilizing transposase RayT